MSSLPKTTTINDEHHDCRPGPRRSHDGLPRWISGGGPEMDFRKMGPRWIPGERRWTRDGHESEFETTRSCRSGDRGEPEKETETLRWKQSWMCARGTGQMELLPKFRPRTMRCPRLQNNARTTTTTMRRRYIITRLTQRIGAPWSNKAPN